MVNDRQSGRKGKAVKTTELTDVFSSYEGSAMEFTQIRRLLQTSQGSEHPGAIESQHEEQ